MYVWLGEQKLRKISIYCLGNNMLMQFSFPQYRKLQDRSYYKILSETEMEEMQRLGKRFVLLQYHAHTFLDRFLVDDLLAGDNGRYETITQEEYEAIKKLS